MGELYSNQLVPYDSNSDNDEDEYDEDEEEIKKKYIFNEHNKEFTQFKENVKEWMLLDDDIKTLQKAMAERKKRKNELTPKIIDFMKNTDIIDLNTKNGKLQFVKSVTTKGLNKNVLISRLGDFFKDIKQGEIAAQYILDGRDKQETFRLKRTVNKNAHITIYN